jgi:Fe-S cluster assembly ATP-binding protein
MALLKLENLHVALEDGTEIVKGVDLEVDTNEVHAIMGPNGSGKSTLAYALMGHPAYEITEGRLFLEGEDVTELGADERAQRGLFLAATSTTASRAARRSASRSSRWRC